MSEWITDRAPTKEDGMSHGCVWILYAGKFQITCWNLVFKNEAWMPIPYPETYVAPNQAKELQSNNDEVWQYIPIYDQGMWCLWNGKETVGLKQLTDEKHHEKAAKRIADIYNEVMP